MTRRRDIIAASPEGAALAFQAIFAPAIDRLDEAFNEIEKPGGISEVAAIQRAILETLDEITPNCPDKLFREAKRREAQSPDTAHAWKCRALDLAETTRPIALGGMVPINIDGWKLAVAIPAPNPLSSTSQPVHTIVLIDPKSGKATIHGSKLPELVEPASIRQLTVHADAKAWAREFASARIEHIHRSREAQRIANIPPVWNGRPPSALAIGKLEKIDWPLSEQITAGEGIDAKSLAKIFRRPATRVHAPMTLRSVA